MMPITASVQNQGRGNSVQPNSSSSVNPAGTRLRRRLSKIFHCESPESGLRWRPAPVRGTRVSSHDAICQSPRIQRWRRATSAL